jgi:hypothetical protein
MTNPLLPQTELDAVNSMLASIGQAPVSTLSVSGVRDVNIAKMALDNTLRSVLLQGWSFNTDTNYELVPDGNNNVVAPASSLWVEPIDRLKNYVIRDNGGTLMFYDKGEHTFTITDNPLEVDIIWAYSFETIPEAARNYVATKASRIFQSQIIGSDILYKFTELQENEALATLKRLEARTKKRNIFDGGFNMTATRGRRFNP